MNETKEAVSLPDPPDRLLDSDECQELLNAYVKQQVGSVVLDPELASETRRTISAARAALDELGQAQAVAGSSLADLAKHNDAAAFAEAQKERQAALVKCEYLVEQVRARAREALSAAKSSEDRHDARRRAWETRYEEARKALATHAAGQAARARSLEQMLRLMPLRSASYSHPELVPFLSSRTHEAQRILDEVTNGKQT